MLSSKKSNLSGVCYVVDQSAGNGDADAVYYAEKLITALRTLEHKSVVQELSENDSEMLDDLEESLQSNKSQSSYQSFIKFILSHEKIIFSNECQPIPDSKLSKNKKSSKKISIMNEEMMNNNPCTLSLKSHLQIIEFIFNAIFSLLSQVIPSDFDSNIHSISTMLSSQIDYYSEINIKLLCILFNLIPGESRLRAVVLSRFLELGIKSNITHVSQFKGRLSLLPKWIKEWQLSVQETRDLYRNASFVARRSGDEESAQQFLIEYLKQWNSTSDEHKISDDIINEASQAVIAAIANKTFNTKMIMELNNSYIVRVMSENAKYMRLYQLLNIVYQGNVQSFIDFYSVNEKYVISLGLVFNHLMLKMQLLTICSLGNIKNIISFDELMIELQVETVDEIEVIIVSAVKQKLMHAKIDHFNRNVTINRSMLRVFNQKSWRVLAKKLSTWRQNTNTVLQIVHSAGMQRYMQDYIQSMAHES